MRNLIRSEEWSDQSSSETGENFKKKSGIYWPNLKFWKFYGWKTYESIFRKNLRKVIWSFVALVINNLVTIAQEKQLVLNLRLCCEP